MKRITLLAAAFVIVSVAAHADTPAPTPPPSLPPYVLPAPSPLPTAPAPGGVIAPIGPNTIFGAGTIPLTNGGRVDGTTVISPSNGWSVQGTVTLPLGGR